FSATLERCRLIAATAVMLASVCDCVETPRNSSDGPSTRAQGQECCPNPKQFDGRFCRASGAGRGRSVSFWEKNTSGLLFPFGGVNRQGYHACKMKMCASDGLSGGGHGQRPGKWAQASHCPLDQACR